MSDTTHLGIKISLAKNNPASFKFSFCVDKRSSLLVLPAKLEQLSS
ncbi:MAG: hypothetical protein ACOCMY_04595 [Campylobacter hyointestinalis]